MIATLTRMVFDFGLAIIWKIALDVKFLRQNDAVEFKIPHYFQYFEADYVLADALNFVVLMMAVKIRGDRCC